MGLITIVYVSVSQHTMTDDELKSLLDECRAFNGPNNVTGMLLYRDGFFIQALEGEASLVEPLYEGIRKDPRHVSVLTVYKNPIETRSFTNWAMGFNKFTAEDGKDIEGFTDFLEKPDVDFFVQHPGRAAVLLNSFRERTYF
jgi:hypothetical protein